MEGRPQPSASTPLEGILGFTGFRWRYTAQLGGGRESGNICGGRDGAAGGDDGGRVLDL